MNDNVALLAASRIIPLIFAIVFHEIAHGWAAYALGDNTAKDARRLSPNPLRHVDPVGTVALPLILAITGAPVFGWAKPVPVLARKLRNPRFGMIWVALAGPGMNLAMAMAASILVTLLRPVIVGGGPALLFVGMNLVNFVTINIFLAIFNLLPEPPFDGGHVVEGLLPRSLARHYAKLRRFAFPLFIFLLLVLPMLVPGANIVSRLVRPPVDWLPALMLPGLR